MEKSCRKYELKASCRPLLKIGYLERRLLKTFKKLTLFFLSNPAPSNGQL